MKANLNDKPLRSYTAIPSEWPARPLTAKYNELPAEELIKDGWRDLITPQLLEFEELGAIEYDAALDRFFYKIEKWTAERIRAAKIAQADAERIEALQTKIVAREETAVQALTTPAELEANKKAFPIWDTLKDRTPFIIGFKVQDYDGKELVLYNCIQPHEKQSDRAPSKTPALWDAIRFGANQIEIWKQPIGGSLTYPYLDPKTGKPYRVIFEGNIWENIHNPGPGFFNTWKPGEFGWKLIGPAA
jgi:hypothetical protein